MPEGPPPGMEEAVDSDEDIPMPDDLPPNPEDGSEGKLYRLLQGLPNVLQDQTPRPMNQKQTHRYLQARHLFQQALLRLRVPSK